MKNSTTHHLSAFLKPNGYIVFACSNPSDEAVITAELQAEYGGGTLLRQFALDVPLAMSGAITQMVAQSIFRAGYPPINAQLELIDDCFSNAVAA